MAENELAEEWRVYALRRIQRLVDIPREQMTDDELSIYTFAANALALGEPVIMNFDRGLGFRLCRVCLAEFTPGAPEDHVSGCPAARL